MAPLLAYFLADAATTAADFPPACTVVKLDPAAVTGANFQVRTPKKAELLVIEMGSLPESELKEAAGFLVDDKEDYDSIVAKAKPVVEAHRPLVGQTGSNALYLQNELENGSASFVVIDSAPENLPLWEQYASRAYMTEVRGFNRGVRGDDSVGELALLTMGPALYVKVKYPDAFRGVKLQGLPAVQGDVKRETGPRSSPEEARARADKKYQELLAETKANKQTHKQIIQYAEKIKSGGLQGKSEAQFKHELTDRVWEQARKPISDWLELEYAARQPPRREPEPATEKPPIPDGLLIDGKRGVAFFTQARFKELEALFKQYCQR
jgi:hypothetical protein